jgi:hypothetical protein
MNRRVSGTHVVLLSSVVVGDLDVSRAGRCPGEANPPLIVDPEAVLTGAVSMQLLQTIPWWYPQVAECLSRINDQQLSIRHPLQIRAESPHPLTPPDPFCVSVRERLDHAPSITPRVNNV